MAFESKLIDELRVEEIRRARAMEPEQKVLAGLELFELACEIMKDGIRSQYPDAGEFTVRQRLRERLALARRMEERP